MDWIVLRKVLASLVLPPAGPLLVGLLGLLLLKRRPRIGRALAWIGLLAGLALATPVVSRALLDAVSEATPLDRRLAESARAIVILSGGVRRDAAEYGGDTLGRLSLERVRYGARVARETGLPVLVTGGVVWRGTAEAEVMRDALEREYGVTVRWTEARSRNTHQNAQFSAAMLREAGIGRVILVAHAVDMRRARGEFEHAGLEVVPAPTLLPSSEPLVWTDFLPGLRALEGSYYALYEMLALATVASKPPAKR